MPTPAPSTRPARLPRRFPPQPPSRLANACLFLSISLFLAPVGCSDPLLSPKDERSPFDRYDAVRQQHATQYIEDKFGRRRPNLQGRLAPKD